MLGRFAFRQLAALGSRLAEPRARPIDCVSCIWPVTCAKALPLAASEPWE